MKLLIFQFIMLCSVFLIGQDDTLNIISGNQLIQVSNNKFIYNNSEGYLHQYNDLIALEYPNLLTDFRSFNKHRKLENGTVILGYVFSLPAIYSGLLESFVFEGVSFKSGGYIGFSVAVGVIVVFKLASLPFKYRKNKYKAALLKKGNIERKEISYIQIRATDSGVGLVYVF